MLLRDTAALALLCLACNRLNPAFDGVATDATGGADGATTTTDGGSGAGGGGGGSSTSPGGGAGGTTQDTSAEGTTPETTTGGTSEETSTAGASTGTGSTPQCLGDGDCDDGDSCTDDACQGGMCIRTPAGGDADGDSVGDVCDVCQIAGFTDDLADYDGDGIPCGMDPCIFDGPSAPMLPTMVGPAEELSLDNIALTPGDSTVALVGPNTDIDVAFDYDIASCGCPNCRTQGVIGFLGETAGPCFYDEVPGCQGESGSADVPVMAPAAPGMYWLAFRRDWENVCATNKPFDPDQVFAAVCVQ